MYFGPQPEMSIETLRLCRATAISPSVQGQPGWATTMFNLGKSAAMLSICSGRPWENLKPRPPGSPAPMAVVPQWISTGAPRSCITSQIGLSCESDGAKPCTGGWYFAPSGQGS